LTFNSLSLRAIAKQSHGIAEPVPSVFKRLLRHYVPRNDGLSLQVISTDEGSRSSQ